MQSSASKYARLRGASDWMNTGASGAQAPRSHATGESASLPFLSHLGSWTRASKRSGKLQGCEFPWTRHLWHCCQSGEHREAGGRVRRISHFSSFASASQLGCTCRDQVASSLAGAMSQFSLTRVLFHAPRSIDMAQHEQEGLGKYNLRECLCFNEFAGHPYVAQAAGWIVERGWLCEYATLLSSLFMQWSYLRTFHLARHYHGVVGWQP